MRVRVLLVTIIAVVASSFSGMSASAAQTNKGPAGPAPAAPDRGCTLKSSAHKSDKDEFQSCFNVSAELSGAPEVGRTADLRVKVTAGKGRRQADVSIDLPDNLSFDATPSGMQVSRGRSADGVSPSVARAASKHDFSAGQSQTFTARVKANGPGTGQIRARVNAAGDTPGSVDAGSDDVFLTIGDRGKPSKLGIDMPAGAGTVAPAATAGASAPAPAPAPSAKVKTPTASDTPRPGKDEAGPSGASSPSASSPGSSCVTGTWNYFDQNGAMRGAVNTVVQAWDQDSFSGDDLLGWVFADWQGRYNICFANDDGDPFSGGTQEVYVKFISQNDLWRMEPVLTFQTGVVNPADDTTYDFGPLIPGDGNFNRGLHAYDEANDAYYWTPGYPCWDPNETTGCNQLVIHWTPTSTDGTYFDLGGDNGVHLAADDPNAAAVVVHETGHFLMWDLYEGAFPAFPNCNPHSIFGVSSTGCAWTEGFAEWYPAGVYNDPNFRWPNGAVQPLDTPTWGYATPGDSLEGWVAGSLIAIADTTNIGPWDHYSEGGLNNPGPIFDLVANDGFHPSTFNEFWNRRAALGYDVASSGALASLYQHTIDYGFRNPLGDNVAQTLPTPTPHNYSYNSSSFYWSAVAVRPPAGADNDLSMYDDYNQTTYLSSSAYGGNIVDFVAVDSNKRALGDYYPRVYQYAGSGDYQVELAQGTSILNAGTASPTMNAGDVISIRDSFGNAGVPKYVRVVPTNAGQDPEVFMMGDTGDPATWVASRSSASAAASATGPGGTEQMVFTPPTSQWYGLVLVNKAGAGTYNMYVDETAPTGSVVIAGGAAYTPSRTVGLTLSASDPETGVDGVQISVDGTLDSEPFQPYSTSKAVLLPAGNGTKTVLVRYRNQAGMISSTFSDTILLDSRPDLTTLSVTNPPATGTRGSSFAVTDNVKNLGATAAIATVSSYYLSLDTVFDASDVKLTGTRSVPALASGASSSGLTTVTIPNTIVGGTYRLFACADSTHVVAEASETNNCRPTGPTIVVQVPDLQVTAVSNPPASAARGSTFSVTDTTRNTGTGPAVASVNWYYLSLDGVVGAGDYRMTTPRNVPALAAGALSTGTVMVTVPAVTAVGTYKVIACADRTHVVDEGSETNDCTPTAGSVNVT